MTQRAYSKNRYKNLQFRQPSFLTSKLNLTNSKLPSECNGFDNLGEFVLSYLLYSVALLLLDIVSVALGHVLAVLHLLLFALLARHFLALLAWHLFALLPGHLLAILLGNLKHKYDCSFDNTDQIKDYRIKG